MRLTFLGAAETVKGASYLLETNGLNILVNCGMFQGSELIEKFNRRPFPYNPADINYVILTDAHMERSGLLPKLVKEGFKGTIYATKFTTELCSIRLMESIPIQEFEAETEKPRGQQCRTSAIRPLYGVEDILNCLKQFIPLKCDFNLELNDGVHIRFRDAGHILASPILQIEITEQKRTTRLVISSNLGLPNQSVSKDASYIEDADELTVVYI